MTALGHGTKASGVLHCPARAPAMICFWSTFLVTENAFCLPLNVVVASAKLEVALLARFCNFATNAR